MERNPDQPKKKKISESSHHILENLWSILNQRKTARNIFDFNSIAKRQKRHVSCLELQKKSMKKEALVIYLLFHNNSNTISILFDNFIQKW